MKHSARPWSVLAVLPLAALLAVPLAAAPEEPSELFFSPSEMPHRTKAEVFESEPQETGLWETLPELMPINPVHAALVHTGKVLIVSGSGNDPDNRDFMAAVWDPATGAVRTFTIEWDMFCNGMVVMPDGRPFVLGGTLRYDPFLGEPRTAAFDPVSETFTDLPLMSGGRWYPTATVLGDGRTLVYSGLNDTGGALNTTVQIWDGSAFTAAGTAFPGLDFYPREHVLPNGKVFVSGWSVDSWLYDPSTHAFTLVTRTQYPYRRVYGTSVLLPLTPGNGFSLRVMILGGRAPGATETTELIDPAAASPAWRYGPAMIKARIQLNATILPSGEVLVSGGSEVDEDNGSAVLEAELYDPAVDAFRPAGTMEFPRLYHSNTLLLPDATVVAVGGNPLRKVYQPEIEIYSPPYLFDASGKPAPRPTISSVPSGVVAYGSSFTVGTPDAPRIASVVAIRPGAATHAFDMEQRMVGLSFAQGPAGGELAVTAPANGNLAPPGYWLLFVLDDAGVPSVARFVRFGSGSSSY
jgi:hypothetical protein